MCHSYGGYYTSTSIHFNFSQRVQESAHSASAAKVLNPMEHGYVPNSTHFLLYIFFFSYPLEFSFIQCLQLVGSILSRGTGPFLHEKTLIP